METPKFELIHIEGAMKELMESYQQTALNAVQESINKQFRALEQSIYEFATPKIKGTITAGKLRWRGIRIETKQSYIDMSSETWISQRGKRIGPVIKNTYKINFV